MKNAEIVEKAYVSKGGTFLQYAAAISGKTIISVTLYIIFIDYFIN